MMSFTPVNGVRLWNGHETELKQGSAVVNLNINMNKEPLQCTVKMNTVCNRGYWVLVIEDCLM